MDEKFKPLDIFLTELIGEDYVNLPDREQALPSIYENPALLEEIIYTADPDAYILEQESPGTIKGIVSQFSSAPMSDVLLDAPAAMTRSVAKGVTALGTPFGVEEPYKAVAEWEREATSVVGQEDKLKQYIQGGVSSALENAAMFGTAVLAAPAIGLNPVTGPAALTAIGMGVLAGSQAMGEHIVEGEGSRLGGVAKGVLSGLTETVMEYIPAKTLSKVFTEGGGSFFKNATRYYLEEIASEVMTTGVQQGLLDRYFETGPGADPQFRLGEAMKDTAFTTMVSATIMPFISAPAGKVLNNRAQAARIQAIEKALADFNKETFVENAVQEGAFTPLPVDDEVSVEQTKAQVKTAIKDNPDAELELHMAERPVSPTAVTLNADMDKQIKNEQAETVYEPGDKVFINVKYNTKGTSATLGVTPTLKKYGIQGMQEASFVSENIEEGTVTVELPSGKQTTITRKQIVPDALLGIRGSEVELGPNNMSMGVSLQIAQDVIEGAKGYFNSKIGKDLKGAYGFVTFDKEGRPGKIALDWALKKNPILAAVAATHEVSHLLLSIGNNLPKSEWKRIFTNEFTKILTGYGQTQNALLRNPGKFEQENPFILQKQQEFVENVEAEYKAQGKSWDIDAQNRVERHWQDMLVDQGVVGIDKTERDMLYKEARAEARDEAKAAGIRKGKDASYNDYVQTAKKRILGRKISDTLASRGMVYIPELRQELKAVSAAVRGFKNKDVVANLRNKGLNVMMGPHYNQEMFADFMTAKLLNLQYREGDEILSVADVKAPNLSRVFDNYLDQNPEVRQTIASAFEHQSDYEARMQRILRYMQQEDSKFAKDKAEKDPIAQVGFGWVNNKYHSFLQNFVNQNYKALAVIEKTGNEQLRLQHEDKLDKLMNISAMTQVFIEEVHAVVEPVLRQIMRDNPSFGRDGAERHLGYYMMEKHIANQGRTKTITATFKDAEGKEVTETYKVPLFNFPGLSQTAEEAQKVLRENRIFAKYATELDKMGQAFFKTWDENVLTTLRDNGFLSDNEYKALAARTTYATYSVYQKALEAQWFKQSAPRLAEQFGTLKMPRNPLAATVEMGTRLLWTAHLNGVKQSMVAKLPSELKTEVKKRNGQYNAPKDNAYSLVTYRDNGEDKGYIIPSEFVRGIEYAQKDSMTSFYRAMGEYSPYFRQLWTTMNPAFVFLKNPIRDFSRLWKNTYDPTGESMGLGAIPAYAGVIYDTFAGVSGNEQARTKLQEELKEMLKKGLPLSDYDFRAGDISEDSGYRVIQKRFIQSERAKTEEQFQRQGLLGKAVMDYIGRNIPTRIFGWYSAFTDKYGRAAERLTKRAAYRYYQPFVDRKQMSQEEANVMVRMAGSPNFMRKGAYHPMLSSIYIFYNPRVQGMYEDIRLMKKSKAVSAKRLMAATIPLATTYVVLDMLIRAVDDDEEFKKNNPALADLNYIWKGIPIYDKENSICIPIALTPENESVYLRLPQDEMTTLFKKVGMRIGRNLSSHRFGWLDSLGGAAQEAGGALLEAAEPPYTPAIGIFSEVLEVLAGGNPYDEWKGGTVVSKEEFGAGGAAKWKPLLRRWYNQLSPTSVIYRLRPDNPNDTYPREPEGRLEWIAAKLKAGYDFPFSQAVLRAGMLKVSSQGHVDEANLQLRELDQYRDKVSVTLKEIGNEFAALYGSGQESPEKVQDVMKKLIDLKPLSVSEMEIFERVPQRLSTYIENLSVNKSMDRRVAEFLHRSTAQQVELLKRGFLK